MTFVTALATAEPRWGAADEIDQKEHIFPAVDAQVCQGLINFGVYHRLIIVGVYADRSNQLPNTLETRFGIASGTKFFTALAIGIASGIGVYETHTRAAWLGALAVLLIGALLATGYRTGFVVALLLVITTVAANWSTFTSADREAGGVGSLNEVDSRLNDIRTAFWAFERKPLEGWGIGRFQSVNTYHHQQWSVDTAFSLGYGEVSHQNELAILAELGIVGLTAWICVLALAAIGVWRAYRTLPDADLCGKPLAVLAMMAMAILISAGMTVDLRFFEFAITVIFLLIGIAIGWADRTSRTPAGAGGILRPTVQHHV